VFKILLSGNDLRLLATRAAVLTRTGADIAFCNAEEAMSILSTEKISLVVLCHSLQEQEAAVIAEKAREQDRETKTLMVVMDYAEIGSVRMEKFDAATLPDPMDLIARVNELLLQSPCGVPATEAVARS
jgi:predicted transcriptional regulator